MSFPEVEQRNYALEAPLGEAIESRDTREKSGLRMRFRALLSVTCFLLLWHTASVTGLFGRYERDLMGLLLPSPLQVLNTACELLATGSLLIHVATSLYRVGLGFILAAIIGIPCGISMALSPFWEDVLQPYVRLFQPIPGVAWVPLAIVWFGLGDGAAVFMIAVGALFPILLNTRQGIMDSDRNLADAARTLGARESQVLWYVLLPSAFPHMITGFRLAAGFAWRVVLAAEMVGVSKGLGYMLTMGRGIGRTDITLVTMLAIGLVMMAMDTLLFGRLEHLAARWRR